MNLYFSDTKEQGLVQANNLKEKSTIKLMYFVEEKGFQNLKNKKNRVF